MRIVAPMMITATIAKARVKFHVDVNIGDPIWPTPSIVHVPRILGGEAALARPLVLDPSVELEDMAAHPQVAPHHSTIGQPDRELGLGGADPQLADEDARQGLSR